MLHRTFGRKLGRDVKERKALYKSLILALIRHGSIRTTIAKAKSIAGLVEKLVTKAKEGTNSSLKQVSSFLTQKEAITKLTEKVAPVMKEKQGGYVRIRRIGRRKGDNAEIVNLEWSIPVEESNEKKRESKKVKKPDTKKKDKKVGKK